MMAETFFGVVLARHVDCQSPGTRSIVSTNRSTSRVKFSTRETCCSGTGTGCAAITDLEDVSAQYQQTKVGIGAAIDDLPFHQELEIMSPASSMNYI